ncbi:sodium channel protein 1 brain-like isoform X1 [Biomphalaria glabrata]|uniref:Sodium channel protein n=1 Tax=Biomphalaria glabrata TaxID=6526 RepID=A0A9W2YQD0_BIOGL|nr:sodium channel protein 1 brain-like isoform X1 [Biomphalaria glabrata]XP_055864988.1 sodium channel protein 1 brain-like isoform X1 [Biomphalaria glabrata]KAI8768913.1 sodium channel protein 1 brain-like isoform X1 [Biomphalaria glabrata]KAI8789145.1 sodium channel protein 1 brain isoform X1 [Biomphalaria glabrata]
MDDSKTSFSPFKPFSEDSYKALLEREALLKERELHRARHAQDAHLVDGELKFGAQDDEDSLPPVNPQLKEGCLLSSEFGRFPSRLLGIPIEEIDPGVRDKTFVVIGQRFGKKPIYRFSATSSLCIFAPYNKLRKFMLRLLVNQFFDLVIFLTIIANCVFLAGGSNATSNAEQIEYIFLGIYTTECVIKIIARGFIMNKHTYLRDPWNWLDFIVIMTAYITILVQYSAHDLPSVNVQGLRTFRVLRALKTVSIVPGLKTMVSALLRAFKMLFEVILLTFFCLMVFSMFGLQIYMGSFRNKCVKNITGYRNNPSETYEDYYAAWIRNQENWYQEDEEYVLCGNLTGSGLCPADYICLPDIGDNPRFGYLSFDHFGWALLTSFQLITLDFWEDIYNKAIRATGPWNVIFFIIVIFFGSFYLINLMLAVVSMSYEEEAVSAGKEKEREKKEKARKKHNAVYDFKPKRHSARKSMMKHFDISKSKSSGPSDSSTTSSAENKSNNNLLEDVQESESRTSAVDPNSDNMTSTGFMSVQLSHKKDTEKTLESYDSVLIIKADALLDPDIGPLVGQVIDRNCNCCEKWMCLYVPFLKMQNYFYVFVTDPLFDLIITFCIFINTLLLSLEHHDQSSALTITLSISNMIFTMIFTLEAICKIVGLGKYYFLVGWNIFDLLIAIASLLDLSLEQVDGLNVLRTFRLLRVFKLAQSWPTMRLLLTIIVSTLGALGNLCLILAIVIYIFAVIGLQLFQTQYTEQAFGADKPRWNFQDFYHSMLMIFRVLCGEWIEPLYDCMQASSEICMVVFLPALVLGNFVVLNLFLALLLNAFASDSLDKHRDSSTERSKLMEGFERLRQLLCCCFSCPNGKVTPSSNTKELASKGKEDTFKEVNKKVDYEEMELGNVNRSADEDSVDQETERPRRVSKQPLRLLPISSFKSAIENSRRSINISNNSTKGYGSDLDEIASGTATAYPPDEQDLSKTAPNCLPNWLRSYCSGLDSFNESSFGKSWALLRLKVKKVVDHRFFEFFILVIIIGSSLSLAFEDIYLPQRKQMQNYLNICNIVFSILFTMEMMLKWLGLGLTEYFTNFWTILDFFIVFTSMLSLIGDQIGLGNVDVFRSLRTLRSLRPLRAISRWQGMKIVVNALMNAIPAIINVFLVCMVFWLIFSIMGVQFFKGKFFKCVNKTTGETIVSDVIDTKSDCLVNRTDTMWENSNVNFDNAANGFLALFQVATFEGWMEIMADAVDATDVDYVPRRESNQIAYLYFVVFVIFGSFFSMNLFIGVIIDNFNVLKKKYEGSYLDAFLTQSQRNYYNTLKKLGKKKPQKTIKRPKNKFQLFFYNLAMSSKFELSIVVLIFLNMVNMAIEHFHQSQAVSEVLEMINVIFTVIFTMEAMVKIIGLRHHYFRFLWNLFDFVIVSVSLLVLWSRYFKPNQSSDDIIQKILDNMFVTPTLLRVIRVFRIGRILRIIKSAKGIRKLLFALIISLPAIFNIGALLFLIMYMYAIIGMSSFNRVKINGVFTEIINFQTFGNSFMLLLRLATSAGWNDILDALLIQSPYCDTHQYLVPGSDVPITATGGDCGTPLLAIPYMVSYIIIVWLIVINMYIAVILENFSQAHEQEELGITEYDFDMFYVTWEKYDPLATQFIRFDQLANFVGELEQPLQLPKPNEIALVSFNIPIMEGEKMHCLDILIALVRNVLNEVEESEELKTLKEQMEAKFAEQFPARVNITVKSSTLQRKKEDVAARTLQRAWRSYKAHKAMRNITALAVQLKIRKASNAGLRTRSEAIRSLDAHLNTALSNYFKNLDHNVVDANISQNAVHDFESNQHS